MATCYRTIGGILYNVSDVDLPCSDTTPTGCCSYGDFCLSNGICHYANPTAMESGYYLQSSTDMTFQSTIGQETSHCTTDDFRDITYNTTTGLWACCSGNNSTGVNCDVATSENFTAPAPTALSTIAMIQQAPVTSATAPTASSPNSRTTSPTSPSISTNTATNSTALAYVSTLTRSLSSTMPPGNATSIFTMSVSTSSNAAAAASSPSSTPSRSTHRAGLSSGAVAGISVGAVVGFAALITLIFLAITTLRNRRRSRPSSPGLFGGPDPASESHKDTLVSHRTQVGPEASLAQGYRPPGFTGEPQFPQEVFDRQGRPGVPARDGPDLGSGRRP